MKQIRNKKSRLHRARIPKGSKKPLWIDRKLERHLQIMALLFFVGFALIYFIGSKTLLTWITISRLFFGIAVIVSFTPKRWLPVIYRFKRELKILLTIFALTPLITGLVLLTNFSFATESYHESIHIVRTVHYPNDYLFKVILENNQLDKYDQLRTFSSDEYNFVPDSAHYIFAKGLFSFQVVKTSYLTP